MSKSTQSTSTPVYNILLQFIEKHIDLMNFTDELITIINYPLNYFCHHTLNEFNEMIKCWDETRDKSYYVYALMIEDIVEILHDGSYRHRALTEIIEYIDKITDMLYDIMEFSKYRSEILTDIMNPINDITNDHIEDKHDYDIYMSTIKLYYKIVTYMMDSCRSEFSHLKYLSDVGTSLIDNDRKLSAELIDKINKISNLCEDII